MFRVPNPKSNKKLQETKYFQSLGPYGPITEVLGRCRKDLVVLRCPTLSYILLLLEGWTKESYQSPQAHSESFSHLKPFSGWDTLVAMLEKRVKPSHFLIFLALCCDVCCLRIFSISCSAKVGF